MGVSGSVVKGDDEDELEWLGLCVETKHLRARSKQSKQGQIQENAWCCNVSCTKDVNRADHEFKLDRERRKAAAIALHRAAEHGILHEVEPIVKQWASTPELINNADSDGNTALHKAAGRDHLEICKILCKVNTLLLVYENYLNTDNCENSVWGFHNDMQQGQLDR
jgi:hypothetical protein